jgi:hypothetical protein
VLSGRVNAALLQVKRSHPRLAGIAIRDRDQERLEKDSVPLLKSKGVAFTGFASSGYLPAIAPCRKFAHDSKCA